MNLLRILLGKEKSDSEKRKSALSKFENAVKSIAVQLIRTIGIKSSKKFLPFY